MSRRQYYNQLLSMRGMKDTQDYHIIWGTCKVAQFFIIDAAWLCEQAEVDHIKKQVQKNLRSEVSSEFVKAIEKRLGPNQKFG